MWMLKSTPTPTAMMRITAGAALSLTPRRPRTPKSSTTMEARTKALRVAAQMLIRATQRTRKTATRTQANARKRKKRSFRYCSQKVNGIPAGKLGSPRSSNFLQMLRT